MLPLWFSNCPQERVWQESSELPFLLLSFVLQISSQSCSSGSLVMVVFILLLYKWDAQQTTLQLVMSMCNSFNKYVMPDVVMVLIIRSEGQYSKALCSSVLCFLDSLSLITFRPEQSLVCYVWNFIACHLFKLLFLTLLLCQHIWWQSKNLTECCTLSLFLSHWIWPCSDCRQICFVS